MSIIEERAEALATTVHDVFSAHHAKGCLLDLSDLRESETSILAALREERKLARAEYADDSPYGKLLPALGCLIREHHGMNYGVTSHTRSVLFDYFQSVGILTPELYASIRKGE